MLILLTVLFNLPVFLDISLTFTGSVIGLLAFYAFAQYLSEQNDDTIVIVLIGTAVYSFYITLALIS